jgi:hypothetical protein
VAVYYVDSCKHVDPVPRNITYVAGSAGDTTQTITVKGFDRYGVAMTETITLNGTTPVPGKKAFYTVISYKPSAALTTTLSMGFGVLLGMPIFLARAPLVYREIVAGLGVTTGTFLAGDLTAPSATTGDVRGTYSPSSAPNGSTNIYELLVAAPDFLGPGMQQF